MILRPLQFSCRTLLACGLGLMLASCGSTKKTADTGAKIDKVKYFHLKDVVGPIESGDPSIPFERSYRLYGAISNKQRLARAGNYYDIQWSAKDRSQPVKVRLEYRQEKTGLAVKTLEQEVASPSRNNLTSFSIIGDDYVTRGPVGSWRVTLLRGKDVLSEAKSYLWE
jgi:hypothetical protein